MRVCVCVCVCVCVHAKVRVLVCVHVCASVCVCGVYMHACMCAYVCMSIGSTVQKMEHCANAFHNDQERPLTRKISQPPPAGLAAERLAPRRHPPENRCSALTLLSVAWG